MLADMAFVGRERELAQLAGTLERGAEGNTSRVVLAGPAGIGITRLLDELDSRIADLPGVVVARGCADPPTAGIAYRSLSDALGSALAKVPDDRLGDSDRAVRTRHGGADPRAWHERWIRSASTTASPPHRSPTSGAAASRRASWRPRAAGGWRPRAPCAGGPPPGRPGDPRLSSLRPFGRPLPLCLLVTYQPEELHRRHPARELARPSMTTPAWRWSPFQPLEREDLTRLVEAELGEPPTGSLMAAVLEGSRGNPLLAAQLVVATRRSTACAFPIPSSRSSARAGFADRRGPPHARSWPRPGGPCPEDLLATRPQRRPDNAKGLAEAIESRLVVDLGASVAIAHELYAEAIEELELPPERHQLHITLANASERDARARRLALGGRVPSDRGACARTWPRPRPANCRPWTDDPAALPAGTRARRGQRAPDEIRPVMAELLSNAARAAATAGAFRRAAAFMRRALDQRVGHRSDGETRRDPGLRREIGAMHVELGRYLWTGGDLVGGVESMEHALTVMPNEPSQPRARALASLAQHLMIDGRFDESAALARRLGPSRAKPEMRRAPSWATRPARWAWTWRTWASSTEGWALLRPPPGGRCQRNGICGVSGIDLGIAA